jgi:hypothetical protein
MPGGDPYEGELESYGYLWILMDSHRCPCMLVRLAENTHVITRAGHRHGYNFQGEELLTRLAELPMDSYGFLWKPMETIIMVWIG